MTQGKPLGNYEEYFGAKYSIDRDFATMSGTHSENGAGWLNLEFDKLFFINRIVIYYRFYSNWYRLDDWCQQSESNFKKCVDKANNVDVSVYQGEVQQKSCGTLQLTYGLEQSDQIYTLLCNTEGDTVKLSKNTGNIEVFEIVVSSTGIVQKYFIKLKANGQKK